MTYQEFKKVASRRGLVRWTTTGIVEIIESGPGGFWAFNPITNRRHRIFNRNLEGKIRQVWHCEELSEDAFNDFYVTAGNLHDAMTKGTRLKVQRYVED